MVYVFVSTKYKPSALFWSLIVLGCCCGCYYKNTSQKRTSALTDKLYSHPSLPINWKLDPTFLWVLQNFVKDSSCLSISLDSVPLAIFQSWKRREHRSPTALWFFRRNLKTQCVWGERHGAYPPFRGHNHKNTNILHIKWSANFRLKSDLVLCNSQEIMSKFANVDCW